jgi:hypothetical protein
MARVSRGKKYHCKVKTVLQLKWQYKGAIHIQSPHLTQSLRNTSSGHNSAALHLSALDEWPKSIILNWPSAPRTILSIRRSWWWVFAA